jgi:signal transduction histidine kinase
VDPEVERLVESRARLVACGDAARAELGRDLHDGPQQRVVGVGLLLRSLRAKLDDTEAVALVDRVLEELGAAGEELREVVRRLHPVALSECGLRPALFAAATRAPLPVELDVPAERLPPEVERAAYDVVLGAIEEAVEEAASYVRVTLGRAGGHVTLAVADDGDGRADPGCARLCGLADRVETVGGTFSVASAPGGGTELRAAFPIS